MQFRRLRVLGKGVGRLRLAYKSSLDFFCFVFCFCFFGNAKNPKNRARSASTGPLTEAEMRSEGLLRRASKDFKMF